MKPFVRFFAFGLFASLPAYAIPSDLTAASLQKALRHPEVQSDIQTLSARNLEFFGIRRSESIYKSGGLRDVYNYFLEFRKTVRDATGAITNYEWCQLHIDMELNGTPENDFAGTKLCSVGPDHITCSAKRSDDGDGYYCPPK